jgi:hypothetical protein
MTKLVSVSFTVEIEDIPNGQEWQYAVAAFKKASDTELDDLDYFVQVIL